MTLNDILEGPKEEPASDSADLNVAKQERINVTGFL